MVFMWWTRFGRRPVMRRTCLSLTKPCPLVAQPLRRLPRAQQQLSRYCKCLCVSYVPDNSGAAVKTSNLLSIRELQMVVSEETIPRPLFCPLGKGSFCFIRSGGGG
jgi:hypothetical protein